MATNKTSLMSQYVGDEVVGRVLNKKQKVKSKKTKKTTSKPKTFPHLIGSKNKIKERKKKFFFFFFLLE